MDMDTSNICKSNATINCSVLSKLKCFLASAILAFCVLGDAVVKYFAKLDQKGLLGLGGDFQENGYMIWGDRIWPNILHILILAFAASCFGFIFGYLSRRISLTEKIIFTSFYVFYPFVSLTVYILFSGETISDFVPPVSIATFIIIGYVAMFVSAMCFMNFGSKVINDPYYTIDKSVSGTLLDIKWYHYFWLSIPISVYIQIILNLIYQTGHIAVTLIQNFKWTTIFGFSDGGKGNALDVAYYSFFFLLIVASIVIYLMVYLRKVLIGETSQHWAVKTLIAIGVGVVTPVLIFWFTALAG